MTQDSIVLGAVAYDPKVVSIWDGFKEWFAARDFAFDYVLYSNYESQVEQHFAGAFHVAWNSPLAWIEAERVARARGRSAEAIAMRDTDQDLTSIVVSRTEGGPASLEELRGKTVGVGASDSPQATLIPLLHLAEAGLEPGRDFQVREFDVLYGKHGDHIGGERDAARALMNGEVDAACAHMVLHHLADTRTGLSEMARAVKPGGIVAAVELLPHHETWMHDAMADTRLGLDPSVLQDDLRAAGFVDVHHEILSDRYVVETPGKRTVQLPLFLLRGRRPS